VRITNVAAHIPDRISSVYALLQMSRIIWMVDSQLAVSWEHIPARVTSCVLRSSELYSEISIRRDLCPRRYRFTLVQ